MKFAELNTVQKGAFELIQLDARFGYSLVVIYQKEKQEGNNYLMMSQPYIGVFTDGAEQWCRKMKIPAPLFTKEEKSYYTILRQGHKLFEASYWDYLSRLTQKLNQSDEFFRAHRSLLELIFGYYNVGTDVFNGEFCGNTVLCALYSPLENCFEKGTGPWISKISEVTGKLASFLECEEYGPYPCDEQIPLEYKDYHFYKKCSLTIRSDCGFLLFSILCSVNYVIEFVDKFFVDEIPQKFKFAYLQYYYLCEFIKKINKENNTELYLKDTLWDKQFRNCLAHYGLGQYLTESSVNMNDPLKGLTIKAFGMNYYETKELLYQYLYDLTEQLKAKILI